MTAQTILPANTLSSGYDVANSLRFDKPSDSYLAKTFSSAGSTRKFTFSTWLKGHETSVHGSTYFFVGNINGSSNIDAIGITNTGIQISINSANSGSLNSTALFRDMSAWYHFVIGVDTTQGTASNRVKVYINGVQITAWDTETYPSENYDFTGINSTEAHNVSYSDSEHNGYLCETVFIDGTQYTADNFGEFNEDTPTIWQPKKVSDLTFGQNGFYLEYKQTGTSQNSSGLGADTSGNDHHFSVNGLAAIDQTTDTCTNNFCTMNPLDNYYAGSTFSEGNCRVVTGSSPETWNTSTFGLSSGKWYMEFTIIDDGSGGSTLIGIADRPTVSADEELGGLATTYAYLSSGNFRTNNSNTSNSVSATDGDIIGVALDLDSGQNTISYYKNNTLIVAAQNITAPVSGNYFIASGVWLDNDTGTNDHNFGNPVVAHSSAASDANGYGSFEYAPPSGYYAICTKNLAEYG